MVGLAVDRAEASAATAATGPDRCGAASSPPRTTIVPTPSYHASSSSRTSRAACADTTVRTSSVSSKPRAASQRFVRSNHRRARRDGLARLRPSSRHCADRARIVRQSSGRPGRSVVTSIQAPTESIQPALAGVASSCSHRQLVMRTPTGRVRAGVAVGDVERLVDDRQAAAHVVVADRDRRDDVQPVEVGERPQAALLARRCELGHRRRPGRRR